MKLVHLTEVEAFAGYRIWLEYVDGAVGELDLSRLVGSGVFKAWEETYSPSVGVISR